MGVPQILGRLQRGIDRTRVRGDATVSALYELTNAYVTTSGRVKKRPGFALQTADDVLALDANTRGLFSAGGKLYTFFSVDSVVELAGVSHYRLTPPTPNAGGEAPTLVAVHFAGLYLGKLYVVAEFSDGNIYDYWLQLDGTWQPDHVYLEGTVVEPTTPNGSAYRATGDDHPPAWQPEQQYAVGDEVQPTVYNGYKYRLTEVAGDNPASGATEPSWPTTEGAQVTEDVDSTPASNPSAPDPGNGTGGRYGNLPGYKQEQLGLLP